MLARKCYGQQHSLFLVGASVIGALLYKVQNEADGYLPDTEREVRMKQLGNLAIVCAKRQDVLLQIQGSRIAVSVGQGPQRETINSKWDDDEKISDIIRELNYGKYRTSEVA